MTAQIYKIADVQTYHSQQVLNVTHWYDSAGTGDPLALCAAYVSSIIGAMRPVQNTSLQHIALIYKLVYPTAGLQHTYTAGLVVAGTYATGDELPSFFAGSVANVISDTVWLVGSSSKHIKRSGYRICGQSEGMVDSAGYNSPVTSSYRSLGSALETTLATNYNYVVASYLDPARARHDTVQAYALVTGHSDVSESTQNTRKYLRGRSF